MNVVSKRFQLDPNLFMAIAFVAIAVDVVRVLPLTLTDAYLVSTGADFHLFLGVADLGMLFFLAAATPTLPAILAMVGGAIVGIVLQVAGVPALSGWVSICTPWLLANRRQFEPTRKEMLTLVGAIVLILCWGVLVISGHVVDPGMQGEDGIGWLYGVTGEFGEDEIHPGLLVQFRRGPFLFVRRIREIKGDRIVLASDNGQFGEGHRGLEILTSDVTGKVSWLFHPGRLGNGLWKKQAIVVGMAAEKLPVPNASALYYNPRINAWVVVGPDWSVIQSGGGKPVVLGTALSSTAESTLTIYDPYQGFKMITEQRFEEAGEIQSSSIVIRYRGDVVMVDGNGARSVGASLPGESLPEATRRLTGLELVQG